MNINEPVTNPRFVEAMDRMKAEPNSENNALYVEELRKAHLLIPVTISQQPTVDENGQAVLKEDTTINFQMIPDPENTMFIPAFTDWQELRKWQNIENQQTMIMTFDDLATMHLQEECTSAGFVINPLGQGFTLNRKHIANLTGRSTSYTVRKGIEIKWGEPKDYPQEMVDAVKRHLKKVREVKCAYLQMMVESDEPCYLLILDFKGDQKRIFEGIAEVIKSQPKNGFPLSMVSADDSFWQKAIADIKPFYKKGLLPF